MTGFTAAQGNDAQDFARQVLDIGDGLAASGSTVLGHFGGRSIELAFHAPSLLERFRSAFVTPIADSPASGLKLHLWEPERHVPPLPVFPWTHDNYRVGGEIPGFSAGRYYIHLDITTNALTVLDSIEGRGAYICKSPDRLPLYERAGPLRWAFHRFALEHGMLLAHAGAVSVDGRAVVIAGPRRAGKSTTVLSCVAGGMSYLGDDRCLIGSSPEPRVYAVYTSAKVFKDEVHKFAMPEFSPAAAHDVADNEDKAVIYMDGTNPSRVVREAAVSAIVLPQIAGGGRSALTRIHPAAAVRVLTSEVIGYSPVTAGRSLAIMTKVCSAVPVYRLAAGPDLREVADTVASVLDQPAG